MKNLYNDIISSIKKRETLLAVLIDPDKIKIENLPLFLKKTNQSITTHIFVGGSTVDKNATEQLVIEIKKQTHLPIVLFPGDVTQITQEANAILFLSLLSGRNSDYLIGKHVQAVSQLRNTHLEVIPTSYILIESGKETAVQRVTQTEPLSRDTTQNIIDTAKAGELLGMKLVYLEAGSGALYPVSSEIIKKVKQDITIPLIVGGGIKNLKQLELAYTSGADIVVIGTAFEEDETFFEYLKK